MIRRDLFVVAMVALLSSPAGAQGITIHGVGNASCGSWLENRSDPTQVDFLLHYQSWLRGFITAANLYRRYAEMVLRGENPGSDVDLLSSTDWAGAYAWLDNYCRDNPTTQFAVGAGALVLHLEGR